MLAIMTALTAVATLVFIVPFPSTQGYFNLGDALVMLSGLLLGPVGGFIAGGGGSAIADLMVYPVFAPITLVAKGCEGLLVGLLTRRVRQSAKVTLWDLLGVILGSVAMLLGYLFGEMFVLQLPFEAAFAELITINSIQVIVGSIITILVGPMLRGTLKETMADSTEEDLTVF